MTAATLLVVAALGMTADAIGYTFGAIRSIESGLAPTDPYWRRRLRLNLMLANHGLYLAAVVAWLAVYFAHRAPSAAMALALVAGASALYSVVTVIAFTRRDAAHAIPRAVALVAYIAYALA